MDILTVFCQIDDFCQTFEPKFSQQLLADGKKKRNKPSQMTMSEVMTILVLFHQSGFRNLKTFYQELIGQYRRADFPHLLSYNRFVELQSKATILLAAFLQMRMGKCSGISFIDSTRIRVCHNLRIPNNWIIKTAADDIIFFTDFSVSGCKPLFRLENFMFSQKRLRCFFRFINSSLYVRRFSESLTVL